MLLALDVRNSGIMAGFREGPRWSTVVRLGGDRSADELGILLEACARKAGFGPEPGIDEAWVSSVVPAMTARVVAALASSFGVAASVVGPGTRTGLKIRTDTPSEMGSDIVCAAVAARELATGAAIVVDFSAAIVLSAIDSAGELLGAAIAPGLETAARSLRSSAAQIPEIRLDPPRRAIGRNTAQSLQSGILFGYGGLVRRLVEMMSAEMAETPTVDQR
ncbi:MAG: pantothenate kinase, partial [Spirochaetae bacterium HGW-Spirochaetae-7]